MVCVGCHGSHEINEDFSLIQHRDLSSWESHSKVATSRSFANVVNSKVAISENWGVCREHSASQNTALFNFVIGNRVGSGNWWQRAYGLGRCALSGVD